MGKQSKALPCQNCHKKHKKDDKQRFRCIAILKKRDKQSSVIQKSVQLNINQQDESNKNRLDPISNQMVDEQFNPNIEEPILNEIVNQQSQLGGPLQSLDQSRFTTYTKYQRYIKYKEQIKDIINSELSQDEKAKLIFKRRLQRQSDMNQQQIDYQYTMNKILQKRCIASVIKTRRSTIVITQQQLKERLNKCEQQFMQNEKYQQKSKIINKLKHKQHKKTVNKAVTNRRRQISQIQDVEQQLKQREQLQQAIDKFKQTIKDVHDDQLAHPNQCKNLEAFFSQERRLLKAKIQAIQQQKNDNDPELTFAERLLRKKQQIARREKFQDDKQKLLYRMQKLYKSQRIKMLKGTQLENLDYQLWEYINLIKSTTYETQYHLWKLDIKYQIFQHLASGQITPYNLIGMHQVTQKQKKERKQNLIQGRQMGIYKKIVNGHILYQFQDIVFNYIAYISDLRNEKRKNIIFQRDWFAHKMDPKYLKRNSEYSGIFQDAYYQVSEDIISFQESDQHDYNVRKLISKGYGQTCPFTLQQDYYNKIIMFGGVKNGDKTPYFHAIRLSKQTVNFYTGIHKYYNCPFGPISQYEFFLWYAYKQLTENLIYLFQNLIMKKSMMVRILLFRVAMNVKAKQFYSFVQQLILSQYPLLTQEAKKQQLRRFNQIKYNVLAILVDNGLQRTHSYIYQTPTTIQSFEYVLKSLTPQHLQKLVQQSQQICKNDFQQLQNQLKQRILYYNQQNIDTTQFVTQLNQLQTFKGRNRSHTWIFLDQKSQILQILEKKMDQKLKRSKIPPISQEKIYKDCINFLKRQITIFNFWQIDTRQLEDYQTQIKRVYSKKESNFDFYSRVKIQINKIVEKLNEIKNNKMLRLEEALWEPFKANPDPNFIISPDIKRFVEMFQKRQLRNPVVPQVQQIRQGKQQIKHTYEDIIREEQEYIEDILFKSRTRRQNQERQRIKAQKEETKRRKGLYQEYSNQMNRKNRFELIPHKKYKYDHVFGVPVDSQFKNLSGQSSQKQKLYFIDQLDRLLKTKNLSFKNFTWTNIYSPKFEFDIRFNQSLDAIGVLNYQDAQKLTNIRKLIHVPPVTFVYDQKFGCGFNASRHIKKHEPIAPFTGYVCQLSKNQKLGDIYNRVEYCKRNNQQDPYTVGTSYDIWSLGPMFNGAISQSKANMKLVHYFTQNGYQLWLVSKRVIKADQHLTWFYGSMYAQHGVQLLDIELYLQSKKCKGQYCPPQQIEVQDE